MPAVSAVANRLEKPDGRKQMKRSKQDYHAFIAILLISAVVWQVPIAVETLLGNDQRFDGVDRIRAANLLLFPFPVPHIEYVRFPDWFSRRMDTSSCGILPVLSASSPARREIAGMLRSQADSVFLRPTGFYC